MIIGIVGSRRRTRHEDYIKLYQAFELACVEYKPTKVISGGCATGADSWAEDIAERFNVPFNDKDYQPDFTGLGKDEPPYKYTERYYARNDKIAKDSDILIAVVANTKGGTDKTIEYFKKHHPNGKLILV